MKEKQHTPETATRGQALANLEKYIKTNPVIRLYLVSALEECADQVQAPETPQKFLVRLQEATTTAPEYTSDRKKANFFPLSRLFTPIMNTVHGKALLRDQGFNEHLSHVLKQWCEYLDSPLSLSVINTSDRGWLGQHSWEYHKLEEYVIPDRNDEHFGFKSFNDFFHRQVLPKFRPVCAPEDDTVVISPCDGTLFNFETKVRLTNSFWVKEQYYSLQDILDHREYATEYENGTVIQIFLDGSDYHRFWTPMSGRVEDVHQVPGCMFSDIESQGYDATAGTYSQGYMSAVNTRTIIRIRANDNRGSLCVIPVGISEVSSISTHVAPGDVVEKGQEIGFFSYGGSSVVLVFSEDMIDDIAFTERDKGMRGSRGLQLRAGELIAKTI